MLESYTGSGGGDFSDEMESGGVGDMNLDGASSKRPLTIDSN
jgi:hypothetical protein